VLHVFYVLPVSAGGTTKHYEKSSHFKGKPGRNLNQRCRDIREEFSPLYRDNSVSVNFFETVGDKSVLP